MLESLSLNQWSKKQPYILYRKFKKKFRLFNLAQKHQ